MRKELKKLMKVNGFELARQKTHAVWKHLETGAIVVTAMTSGSKGKYELKNTMRQIRKEIGVVYAI